MKLKIRKKTKITICIMFLAALVGVVSLGVSIMKAVQYDKELSARIETLTLDVEEEKDRRQELDEYKLYVKSRSFIEKKANSLGYIYPDEILYKKAED